MSPSVQTEAQFWPGYSGSRDVPVTTAHPVDEGLEEGVRPSPADYVMQTLPPLKGWISYSAYTGLQTEQFSEPAAQSASQVTPILHARG